MDERIFSQIIATIFLVFAIIFFGFVAYKVKKDPRFQKQDPGKVVLYLLNKYLVSWLLCLQVLAIISEAAMIGSASDAKTNVGSRMTLHISMNLAGILASLLWVRSMYEFVKVLISKKTPGEKFALSLISLLLLVLTLGLAVYVPYYNMMALANVMDNTIQLELFGNYLKYKIGFMSQSSYFASIIEAHDGLNPGRYAAFANLHPAMVSSVGITVVHICVMVWEILFVLKLSITQKSFAAVMGEDLEEYMKEEDAKDKAKGAKDPNAGAGGTPPDPKKSASQVQVQKVLQFCGIKDDKLADWTKKVLALYAGKDGTTTAEMTLLWGKYFVGVKHLETGAKKTAEGLAPDQLIDEVRTTLKTWSNGSLTLPAKNV